jgi:hypothetical protein
MDYKITNRPSSGHHIKRVSQIFASTLCLGLLSPMLSVFAQTTPAQTTPAPITPTEVTPAPTTPVQTQPDAPASPVAQKLYGQWLAKDPKGEPLLMFIFTPTGKLYIMPPPKENEPSRAIEMGYKIDSTTKPMHLDVQLDTQQTVLTVFDFTTEGQMRLQLEGTNPGQPRPSALTETATNFEKISDTPTLPPETEIMSSNQ